MKGEIHLLYKKNTAPKLSDELFKNPTCEYRGTPFWAWNSWLTKEELERQIDVFKEMGLGGFHMHVRTGLKNQYLSDEYMQLVKDCVKKAKANGMLAHLYDEDRWPSGAAGGLVTKDERYRARCLLFTPVKDAEVYHSDDSCSEGGRCGRGTVMACYDVVLDDKGYLASYKRIDEADEAQGVKWYALLEVHTPSSWYNGQTYADTLSKEAIEKFIEVTHQRYFETVGDEFDETVPSIFTDEPQFTRKKVLENSFDKMDILMPWTDKVPELYKEYTGEDIFATLPELFWDLPGSAPSRPRYLYHDFIAELFARSFADTIGGWCREHKLALTGHMMEEPTLRSQCAALGEAMRSYRGFDIPGIDLLCNGHEFTTAKQAQSAVHQFGYEGMLSELYGVTGWDCDFRTYKHQGDWQAALGVTVRVPHLSWYAMGGEGGRDPPHRELLAALGPQRQIRPAAREPGRAVPRPDRMAAAGQRGLQLHLRGAAARPVRKRLRAPAGGQNGLRRRGGAGLRDAALLNAYPAGGLPQGRRQADLHGRCAVSVRRRGLRQGQTTV